MLIMLTLECAEPAKKKLKAGHLTIRLSFNIGAVGVGGDLLALGRFSDSSFFFADTGRSAMYV